MYNNSNIVVTGGQATHVAGDVVHNYGQKQGFEQLQKHVAAGALHNSGEVSDESKCHPGTHVAILEHLEAWARALTYIYPIIWLHGPSGVGKSSILRTMAQILFDHGLLLGSFFFLRSAVGRNSSEHFLPTIAYQLALRIPHTRPYIGQAIERDPLIFALSLWDQAQALIVSPILAVLADNPSYDVSRLPRVIIIDGLDECNDPDKQSAILEVMCRVLEKLPFQIALLIGSRPEHHIRIAFDVGNLNKLSSRLALDNSDIRPANPLPQRLQPSRLWPCNEATIRKTMTTIADIDDESPSTTRTDLGTWRETGIESGSHSHRHPPRNPFTPATPAVQALVLQRGNDSEDNYDSEDRRRHRPRESKDHKDRSRDMERNRDRERGRQPDPTRPQQKRHRSASHTVPPPLPITQNSSSTSIYPTYQYSHPPRLTSARDSRHSSRSSSTQVALATSYFPSQQVSYSAPPYKQVHLPPPVRSQTPPAYGHPNDKYGYSTPYWPKDVSGYPPKPVDLANAPQLPFSAYQTKQPPLLKRLFMGLTGGNKQQSRRVPRRKRSSSF